MSIRATDLLVLGNGPSLKPEFFEQFSGVRCLGMNAAYRYWDRIAWYPDLYCCLDDQLVLSHADEITRLIRTRQCKIFFLHQNILTAQPHLAEQDDVYFLPQLRPGENSALLCDEFGLAHRPSPIFQSTNPSKLTTGSYSLRFAAYLGFRRLGLIGIDCRYVEYIQGCGRVGGLVLEMKETPASNPNYFFSDYQQKGDRYNIPNPEVHQGNLHLQAFEALRDDIAEYNIDMTVSVCTTASELYDQHVFPYKPLDAFVDYHALSAVFMPFTTDDVEKLVANLRTWARPGQRPYIFPPSSPRVALHLAMNGFRDTTLEDRIRDIFAQAKLSRYFSEIVFHYSELDGLRDLYTRDFIGDCGPEGYMAGPNNQFFDIINTFSEGMSHITVIEADAVPIRADWLRALADLAAGPERFWICGSHYRGRARIKAVTHINGNAVYHVGDPGFRNFFKTRFLPYFYDRMKSAPHLCYDILLHDYFAGVHTGDADNERLAEWKRTLPLLRYANIIVDLSHDHDRAPENLLSLDALRNGFPDTYLVHGAVDKLLGPTVNGQPRGAMQSDVRNVAITQPAGGDSQGVPEVFLIDPDCTSYMGHYMAYNARLSAIFAQQSLHVTVLANTAIDKAVVADHPEIDPRLSFRTWEIHDKAEDWPDLVAARRTLTEIFMTRRAGGQVPPAVVYMYCGTLEVVQIFRELFEKGLDLYVHINLFRAPFLDVAAPRFVRKWSALIHWLDDHRDRFTVTAPTVHVQQDMIRAFKVCLPVAVHPGTAVTDDDFPALQRRQRPAAAPARVVFPGSLRTEKGRYLTIESIQSLHRIAPDVVCALRLPQTINKALADDIAGTLPDNIDAFRGELTTDEFNRMFMDSHVAVIPYLPKAFAKRTSGILIDAIYFGLPVVALPGTWLADTVADLGCGVVAQSATPAAIVEAVQTVLADLDAFQQRTTAAARTWFKNNSWSALAHSILDTETLCRDSAARAQFPPPRSTAETADPLDIAFSGLRRRGIRTIALYGAGAHTRKLIERQKIPDYIEVRAVVDDYATGTVCDIPVVKPDCAAVAAAGCDAIVISSDTIEAKLWRQAVSRGLHPVFTLYGWQKQDPDRVAYVQSLFRHFETCGLTHIAIYGGGLFTHNLMQADAIPDNGRVACILDDGFEGKILDTAVRNPDNVADVAPFDTVVIASDTVAARLRSNAVGRGCRNVYVIHTPPNEDQLVRDFMDAMPSRSCLTVDRPDVPELAALVRGNWEVHAVHVDERDRRLLSERFGNRNPYVHIHDIIGHTPATADTAPHPAVADVPVGATNDGASHVRGPCLPTSGVRHIEYLRIGAAARTLDILQAFPWRRTRPAVVLCRFDDAESAGDGPHAVAVAAALKRVDYRLLVSAWQAPTHPNGPLNWQRFTRDHAKLGANENVGWIIGFADVAYHQAFVDHLVTSGFDVE